MGLATAAAALLATPVSAAPNDLAARTRGASAQNVFGAPHANACAAAASSGRATEAAIDDCSEALSSEGLSKQNKALIYINRGAMYLRLNNGDAALADFDAALMINPKSPEAHLNRGAALVMVKKPGLAVGAITTALQLGVRDPHKAYFNRGAARESLGDIRGAFEDYSTALAIKPDWAMVEGELARFAKVRRDRLAAALGEDPNAPPKATP